jgi:hypothetical protein
VVALLRGALAGCALGVLASQVATADLPDRHEIKIEFDWNLTETRSDLGAWPEGGYGKLRQDSHGSDYGSTRLAVEYLGQIRPTLFVRAVMDAVDDGTTRAGLTEAYLEWRPLPSGLNRNRLRFGAFYPAFSMENSGHAWASPYTRSFSAINAWLGEEIRPVGLDWRLNRPLGAQGSPGEISAVGGIFYGNDPAGTLLFWRGWAVHDRQTRLNERLPLPPLVVPGQAGNPDIVIERQLDPMAEIDDQPGFYAGAEWRYARRARLSLSFYDNRADPYAFRDGQWAWGTRFWHLAGQVSLPGDVGLIAQAMRGDTDWLIRAANDGTLTPLTRYVTDEFDAAFVLLSKALGTRHRVSLRLDRFDMWRPGELSVDNGDAFAAAYSLTVNPRLAMQLEWMRIKSSRDLWPSIYGRGETRYTEKILQLGFKVALFDSTS